jgi:hypothetical protein
LIYWHYTVGVYIMQIIADNLTLRPGNVNGGFFLKGERPAIYFTRRETWEPTATKGIFLPDAPELTPGEAIAGLTPEYYARYGRKATVAECAEVGHGLFRIGVAPDAAPVTWEAFVESGGLPRKMARALKRSAHADGSRVEDWRLRYDPLPFPEWARVELWNGREWIGNLKDAEGVCLLTCDTPDGTQITWQDVTMADFRTLDTD